ncbi:MAG: hypothetical protein ACLPX5_13225 [Dissulfurispiraceae bacterium]
MQNDYTTLGKLISVCGVTVSREEGRCTRDKNYRLEFKVTAFESSIPMSLLDPLCLDYAVSVPKSPVIDYPVMVKPVSTLHFREPLPYGSDPGRSLVILVSSGEALRLVVDNNGTAIRFSTSRLGRGHIKSAHKVNNEAASRRCRLRGSVQG